MTTFEKPIHKITLEDLQTLVSGQVPEGRQLEYKETLPGSSDADKREFLADVSSFANSSGGDLYFGISEAGGQPRSLIGLDSTDTGNEQLRLESIIRGGLQPRLPRVAFRSIPIDGQKACSVTTDTAELPRASNGHFQ